MRKGKEREEEEREKDGIFNFLVSVEEEHFEEKNQLTKPYHVWCVCFVFLFVDFFCFIQAKMERKEIEK